MNTRALLLSSVVTLSGIGAALPAFANTPNMENYGAGFLPSPLLSAQNNLPVVTGTANYGAGFIGSPELTSTNNIRIRISPANYGAGFFQSPRPWYGYGYRFYL